jgi:hypothetical protein
LLSLLLRKFAVSLCAHCSLMSVNQVKLSFPSAAHRQSHGKDYEHERNRDDNHDNSR